MPSFEVQHITWHYLKAKKKTKIFKMGPFGRGFFFKIQAGSLAPRPRALVKVQGVMSLHSIAK